MYLFTTANTHKIQCLTKSFASSQITLRTPRSRESIAIIGDSIKYQNIFGKDTFLVKVNTNKQLQPLITKVIVINQLYFMKQITES